MDNVKKQGITEFVIVAVIIVLTLARIVYLYAFEKTGEHSDEIWSYGLSNSYYEPFVYCDDRREELKNENSWITGEYLNDYITVRENERFSYGSVTYNLKHDFHPPFYFYLLHTICSFFPDTYSRWFAFSINIAVYPVLMIYLYLLACLVCRGRKGREKSILPYCVIAFYGLASGGVSTFVFARHYAMLTMWTVMFTYYTFRLLKKTDEEEMSARCFGRNIIVIAVISALGCLTQYFFAAYAFVVTALVMLWFFIKKYYKKTAAFGAAMLVSVMPMFLMTGVLESTKSRTGIASSVTDGEVITLPEKIKTCVECFLYDFFAIKFPKELGYYISIFASTLLFILIIALPVLALYVKKNRRAVKELLLRKAGQIRHLTLITYIEITLALSIMFIIAAYCILSGDDNMEALTNRYLFLVYPFFALLVILAVNSITGSVAGLIRRGNGRTLHAIAFAAVFAVVVAGSLRAKIYYLFPRVENEKTIEELSAGRDVILVMTEHWLLTCYTDLLNNADDILVLSTKTYRGQPAELYREKYENGYVVFDVSKLLVSEQIKNSEATKEELYETAGEKLTSFFKEIFPDKSINYLERDEIFTREVIILEIK